MRDFAKLCRIGDAILGLPAEVRVEPQEDREHPGYLAEDTSGEIVVPVAEGYVSIGLEYATLDSALEALIYEATGLRIWTPEREEEDAAADGGTKADDLEG